MGTGARMMCSAGSSVAESSGGGSAVEASAGDLALVAQIKAKGDAIRDLKAGGASKDDLKPHIEVRPPATLLLLGSRRVGV